MPPPRAGKKRAKSTTAKKKKAVVAPLTHKNCPFIPLDDALIIKRLPLDMTTGGIAIPESAQHRKGKFGVKGVVLAVGEGRMLEGGTVKPMSVVPGETIVFSGLAGLELDETIITEVGMDPEQAKEVLLLRQADVICRLK